MKLNWPLERGIGMKKMVGKIATYPPYRQGREEQSYHNTTIVHINFSAPTTCSSLLFVADQAELEEEDCDKMKLHWPLEREIDKKKMV